MRYKAPADFKPYDWPQSGRPIQPYRLDPVTISDEPLAPWEQEVIDPATQPYIIDPLHTEILKLAPDAGGSFVAFATRFGLHEFHDWAATAPRSFNGLRGLLERYDTGIRQYTLRELHSAWAALPAAAIRYETDLLRRGFALAQAHVDEPTIAVGKVLDHGWERQAFRIELGIDETTDTPVIYERPQHIWARAWFELVEDLRAERFPKTCSLCGSYFIPRRRNRKFCTDNCRNRAYDRKRSRDPNRREEQHAQYLRRKEAARGSTQRTGEPRGGDQ